MDKNKAGAARGSKSKTPQYPSDLIALGKSSGEPKRTSTDRKREGPPIASVPVKKVKTSSSAGSSPRAGTESWEMVAVDIEPSELVPAVLDAFQADQADRYVGLICGAIKTLRTQRKQDTALLLGLQLLCKLRPALFSESCVMLALCSLLRRDPTPGFKAKGNVTLQLMSASLLAHAYQGKRRWPEEFVKLWLDDALSDRAWVDHPLCAAFSRNVVTAFNTKPSPPPTEPRPPSPAREDGIQPVDVGPDNAMKPRYPGQQPSIELAVLAAVKEQLNRRQPPENITRNFLRLLSATSGLVEIRALAASRLELWLQNPKLNRPAQDLLLAVCANCTTHGPRDVEVIAHLVKIRLKTKALVQFYLTSMRELIAANPANLETVMKHTVYNELSSTARNPNNMAMLAAMFQACPEPAATLIAEIFQDLLMNREDYLRPLRALLREAVRVARSDLNIPALCRGLMADRTDLQAFREFECKERMFTSIIDLITLCIFLSITPAVREASSLFARGDKRDLQVLQRYQLTVAGIQRDAVWWFGETVPAMYSPSTTEFVRALFKLMFLEQADQYHKVDSWPSESERGVLLRLAQEVPLLQHTLIRILVISLKPEDRRLSAAEALDLVDQLVRRTAGIAFDESQRPLKVDKLEVVDLLFNLSTYHHPDTISLPDDFSPPAMAIAPLYWKSWCILLALAAHNPSTLGLVGWAKYPTLRTLMEMSIMNHFTYPTPTMADDDEARAKELQLAAREKSQILEYESLLAAASNKTITEQTSLLLSTLVTMDPTGPSRKPPPSTLELLTSINGPLRLGVLLCASRSPDFLQDIIQTPGAAGSKPWMADLVNRSDGELSNFPVQCLCECLLSATELPGSDRQPKLSQLLTHLQQVLTDPEQEAAAAGQVLQHILRRLGWQQTASRRQATKAMKMLLSAVPARERTSAIARPVITDENRWLLVQLPLLPHFPVVRSQVSAWLRQTFQVENDVGLMASYLAFLVEHTLDETLAELTEVTQDMAQLVVERSSICAVLLPSPGKRTPAMLAAQHSLMMLFDAYLTKARSPQREAYPWSDSMDQILVSWPNRDETTMHILIAHALTILLTHGPGLDNGLFNKLLDIWFPAADLAPPQAILVDTSEPALLLPDWLRLRMIRSTVDRLVDAALANLEPHSLILFIQSFGIPVSSMDKLLVLLDQAVERNASMVTEAVLDKTYMVQLVQVQRLRGARGGHALEQALAHDQPKPPEASSLTKHPGRPSLPIAMETIEDDNDTCLTGKRAIEIMETLFGSNVGQGGKEHAANAFRILQRGIAVDLQNNTEVVVAPTVDWLCRAGSPPTLAAQARFSCPLLRLLARSRGGTRRALETVALRAMDSPAIVQAPPLAAVFAQVLRKRCSKLVQPKQEKTDIKPDPDAMDTSTPMAVEEDTKPRQLVDWLVELEPELCGSTPGVQMELLFSRPKSTDAGVKPLSRLAGETCRPYLLTLLTHRASWLTLHSVVCTLLAPDQSNYDPSAVLDFLSALTSNPRLWQGREKKTPKHCKVEDVLCLTDLQIEQLVLYITQEGSLVDARIGPAAAADRMKARLPLLCQCAGTAEKTRRVAKQLAALSSDNGREADVCRQLLVQLYLRLPCIAAHLTDFPQSEAVICATVVEGSSSSCDRVSHTLLTGLTETAHAKDWLRRGAEYELALRKLAARHPALLLRQLPMLAAALRGRHHLDWAVLRSRHHLSLFHQALGLMQLLSPLIFRRNYSGALYELLDTYLRLCGVHLVQEKGLQQLKKSGGQKEAHTLLNQLVDFLQDFVANDAAAALKYLQNYGPLLHDIQRLHAGAASVRQLLLAMSLPARDENDAGASADPAQPHAAMLAALARSQGDDALATLQELDQLSLRKVSVLESFSEPLAQLLLSPSREQRTLAHTLLARHLRHNPLNCTIGVTAFFRCLESEQPDVVVSALDKLPELVLVAQEHGLALMEKVFSLGLRGNINVAPCISKTNALLNIQKGC